MPGDEVREAQRARKKNLGRKRGARPTIGLLIGQASDPISWTAWRGVNDVAQEHDVSLICFVGGTLNSPIIPDIQANVIYDLVGPESLDGLVVWSGGVGQYTSPEEMKAFCERYHPMPTVSVAQPLEGIPSVMVNNYDGMHEVILHLIEVHGYRRIAFIRGPEGHAEADERYRAYVDALAKHDIPLDPGLVVFGNFESALSVEVTNRLLDERRDFEVIASADDSMAMAALATMQARGIQVPDEVAVVGFDDEESSRYATPPLTTVSAVVYEQGRQAAEMVLALSAGETVPESVSLPARAVIRQSCGCPSPWVTQAAAECRALGALGTSLMDQKEHILTEIAQGAADLNKGFHLEWAAQVLDAFVDEIDGKSPGAFLATLNDGLQHTIAVHGEDMAVWQQVISIVRRYALDCFDDMESLTQTEDLWHQARVLIWEVEQRVRAEDRAQAESWAEVLNTVGQALITATSSEELMDAAAQALPLLNIPSFYLALYEDPAAPAGQSRLLLAYDEEGHVELEAGGLGFPSRQLLPPGLPRPQRRYSLVAEPLHVGENHFGFALIEVGPQNGTAYEMLGSQVSNALREVFLVERMERRAVRLQTAALVSRATSGTLDPNELIQQVVDLARERFALYYAGLFLVDETGLWTGERNRWAVLRAGTGKAGQDMLAQGHKLEIGGESMIGQCVATRKARIALDVGKEAVRFDNPHLPETRSELALPLTSRGAILGALTIQSIQEAAFSEEDITVLQIMADQLANAISNARLFEQSQVALQEMEAVQRRYLQQAWSEYMHAREIEGYEHTGVEMIPLGGEIPPGAQQALAERRPVVWNDDGAGGASVLIVPVMLRNRPLGVLGFRGEAGRQWADDDIALAEAISQQFSQAAEALRLLDVTQRGAAREQLIGQVTGRIRESLDLETVLRTAASEMRQALGLEDLVIRLVPPESGDKYGQA